MDRSRNGLQDWYAGSQLPFSSGLTHASVVGTTIVEVQNRIYPDGEGGGSAGTKRSAPVPPKR